MRFSLPSLWLLVTLLCVTFLTPHSVSAAANSTSCPESLANDLAVLQYALTLEHLESTFYNTFNEKFGASAFQDAGYDASVFSYFQLIQAHENAHVIALSEAIVSRGGKPVPACNYSFDAVTSVATYIATAQVLENVGTSAYDGGINGISDPALQQTAATIATIEARHAGYLNSLIDQSSFPNVTDPARTPAQVVALAAGFIHSCPYAWNDSLLLPTIRPQGASFVSFDNPPPSMSPSLPPGTYTNEQLKNDLIALNYALTLEHLEATFYTQGMAKFTRDDFTSAGFNSSVYDNFALITAHEVAHVSALEAVIDARAGTPVRACTYNFNLSSVKIFVSTAQLLENTGVSAYDGAVNGIADTGVQMVAATIATVEARHAQYLNLLNSQSPFPNATDTPVSPEEIIKAASAFIASCPDSGDLPLPTVAPAANTTCKGARAPIVSPTCSLTGLAFSGSTLSPAFSSSNTQYTCSGSGSSTGTFTVTSGVAGATIIFTSEGSTTNMVSGQASDSLTMSSNSTILVAVPSVLLALGDSITFGETDLMYGTFSGDRGYPALIADFIDQRNGDLAPRPAVVNLAIDGETASSWMTGQGRTPPVVGRTDVPLAQENEHYSNQPSTPQKDVFHQAVNNANNLGLTISTITITLGFNEVGALVGKPNATSMASQTLSDYRANYRKVLTTIRTALPDADLYMLGYYNPFPADPSNPATALFDMAGPMLNAIVAELSAEFNGFFVDTSAPFVGHEANYTYLAEQPAGQSVSGSFGGVMPIGNVHPNDQGYAAIADLVIKRMKLNGTTAGDCGIEYVIDCSTTGSETSTGSGGGVVGGDSSTAAEGSNGTSPDSSTASMETGSTGTEGSNSTNPIDSTAGGNSTTPEGFSTAAGGETTPVSTSTAGDGSTTGDNPPSTVIGDPNANANAAQSISWNALVSALLAMLAVTSLRFV